MFSFFLANKEDIVLNDNRNNCFFLISALTKATHTRNENDIHTHARSQLFSDNSDKCS